MENHALMQYSNRLSRRSKSLVQLGAILLLSVSNPLSTWGQSPPNTDEATTVERPLQSDPICAKIIQNYLTASGGEAAHRQLKNIKAQGILIEAGRIRDFELIETATGKRRITYKWRSQGRNHTEIHATNGSIIWQQQIQPKLEFATPYSGTNASHFAHQFWFIQPSLQPDATEVVYTYQNSAKVAGRSTHLVVAHNAANVRTWFYFDKETFLPIRWGGIGRVASVDEYVDYRSIRFEAVEHVMLPKAIDLLIEDNAFGEIQFTSIRSNLEIDESLFEMPVHESPVLRQKSPAEPSLLPSE